MNIVDLFLPACMTMDLQAHDKWEAIRELSLLLQASGSITSLEGFEAAVRQREREVSTGVGFGIGIPHGRSSAVLRSSIAFGKSRQGIAFEAIDDKPVQLVFLLAVPETIDDREYLGAISRLARLIVHEDFRDRLMAANTIEEILAALGSTREHESAR